MAAHWEFFIWPSEYLSPGVLDVLIELPYNGYNEEYYKGQFSCNSNRNDRGTVIKLYSITEDKQGKENKSGIIKVF